MIRLVSAPIRIYQRVVSPALPARCKYYPSCSSYAVSALRSYGIVRGTALAAWRLVRCNPWSHGGYDPVEAQTLFNKRPSVDAQEEQGSRSERTGALA